MLFVLRTSERYFCEIKAARCTCADYLTTFRDGVFASERRTRLASRSSLVRLRPVLPDED